MKLLLPVQIALALFFFNAKIEAQNLYVLNPSAFSNYVAHFNSMEDENVTNFISNADSWNWLQKREIPFSRVP